MNRSGGGGGEQQERARPAQARAAELDQFVLVLAVGLELLTCCYVASFANFSRVINCDATYGGGNVSGWRMQRSRRTPEHPDRGGGTQQGVHVTSMTGINH